MTVTIARFIECLTSTGVLEAGDLTLIEAAHPAATRDSDADALARDLAQQGKLTRYQAAALYQDKSDTLLLGNYVIFDKIGAGGMGQVFRARHRKMDRIVALKVLSKKALATPDALARFQREVKAAAKLTHANIVTAHDADEAGGVHYLVMEYVEGKDLAETVKANGPLGVASAIDCTLQAARGLEHAHREGIVHRDVKPSNLLLSKHGMVKILDLGLARIDNPLAGPESGDGLTTAGSVMGTIDFMSPEQALDTKQADARSDIYSLGCTLYYLLTGQKLYDGDTIMKKLLAHRQQPIPSLRQARSDVPAAIDEVYGKMVAKNPADRYQTMREAREALEAATTKRSPIIVAPAPVVHAKTPGIARPAVSSTPATKPATAGSGRRSVIAGILAVVALTLGGWALYGVLFRIKTPAGTVVIEVDQPGTAVVLDGKQRIVLKPANGGELVSIAIEAGRHELVVTKGGFKAYTHEFVVNDGESGQIKVRLEPLIPPTKAIATRVQPKAATEEPSSPPTAAAPNVPQPVPVAIAAPAQQSATVATVDTQAPAPATVESSPAAEAAELGDGFAPLGKRRPVPSATEQEKAKTYFKDVFGAELAQAKKPEEKIALAEKLIEQSQVSAADGASGYVLLNEARSLAVDAGNVVMLKRLAEQMAATYDVDALQLMTDGLERLIGRFQPLPVYKEAGDLALVLIDRAVADEDFAAAERANEAALAAARKARDASLLKAVVDGDKQFKALKLLWDESQKAIATLEQNPDDPAANLAQGRWLCFGEGDWTGGFEHLAKSSDAVFRALAEKSHAAPNEPDAQVALGDAWWDAAETGKGRDKEHLRAGAGHWYTLAIDALTGLAKTRVEKRLAELGGVKPVSVAATVLKRASIVLASTNPSVQGAKRWQQFRTEGNAAFGDLAGLTGDGSVTTLNSFTGPLDIELLARTDTKNIRLHAYGHSHIIWNWEVRPRELRVVRPDGTKVQAKVEPLKPNTWYRLRWIIRPTGSSIYVDDKLVLEDAEAYDLSLVAPVRVTTYHDAVVELQSFKVSAPGGSSPIHEGTAGSAGSAVRGANVLASTETAGLGTKKWQDFQSVGEVLFGNDARITGGAYVFSRQSFTGSLDISLVARTNSTNIRLYAYGQSLLIWNWELNPRELRIWRPDGTALAAEVESLEPNTWYRLRWIIQRDGSSIYVNDKLVFQDAGPYDVSIPSPVKVSGYKAEIVELRSLVVNSTAEAAPAAPANQQQTAGGGTSKPSSVATKASESTANGLAVPPVLDCSRQTYNFPIGATFDCTKSWTLKLDYSIPAYVEESQMIFYFGEKSGVLIPIYVQEIPLRQLRVRIMNSQSKQHHQLYVPIEETSFGQWKSLTLRFDAPAAELSIYRDGVLLKKEPAAVQPTTEGPMAVSVGSIAGKSQRFAGQVRNIWLGNQDKFTLPAAAASSEVGAAPVTSPAMQSTIERDTALAILRVGDEVHVTTGSGKPVKLDAPEQIPSQPFVVSFVILTNKPSLPTELLSALGRLARLNRINATGTKVTVDNLACIGKMQQLDTLSLGKSGITDEGLAQLTSLRKLETLGLTFTSVTDAGLKHLATTKSLKHITLGSTKVTDAGVAELQAALPGCKIEWDDPSRPRGTIR